MSHSSFSFFFLALISPSFYLQQYINPLKCRDSGPTMFFNPDLTQLLNIKKKKPTTDRDILKSRLIQEPFPSFLLCYSFITKESFICGSLHPFSKGENELLSQRQNTNGRKFCIRILFLLWSIQGLLQARRKGVFKHVQSTLYYIVTAVAINHVSVCLVS